ncbi:VOC family protein [Modestobacter sp. VKM Ac-2977]|uniref:VOC family protein n=1 Tax=Modestobacter sp. VKM Ac-2977 TaxID=3004131 RepID=UPI0022AA2D2F|nr:VOC family protein [Modestobacter sp. VKM Ac-2977]MCZ2820093.1 VOC family protein [Modestobacter sp. VKM Ac-2977]
MAALLSHVSVDSHDAHAQSLFWGAVLGWADDPADPNETGDEECMVFSPDGRQRLLFIEVPEGKSVKNRLHLDLRPATGTRDEELPRLLELGAVLLEDRRRGDGSGWYVLGDPEGNEFCLLVSEAERAASR